MSDQLLTTYEWVIESVDEHGDIIEVTHADLKELDALKTTYCNKTMEAPTVQVAVLKVRGNEVEGEVSRDYWYILGNQKSGFESTFQPPQYVRVIADRALAVLGKAE